MLVTLFGMVMDVKLVHPLNVNCSMVVMLIPIVTEVSLVHSSKIFPPMLVTPLPMMTEVRSEQLANVDKYFIYVLEASANAL